MKKIAKVFCAVVLVLGALAIGHRAALGSWPDPEADLGLLRIIYNGAVTWKVGSTGDNNLTFIDNTSTGGPVFKIYPGAGGAGGNSRTSTQLKTDVPGAAGTFAYNSTNKLLCISTGTNAGAWVGVASSSCGAVGVCGTPSQCY